MSDKHEWVPIILQWTVSGYMKICIAADTQPLDFFQYLLPCPFTMGGCVCVYLVRVPQADCAAQRQLPHQQVVHPAEGELQILHLTLLEVQVHVLCIRTNKNMTRCDTVHNFHFRNV